MNDAWTLGPCDGELLIRTGVAGRAARMGHRLTLEMARWHATVSWDGEKPVGAELVVEVDSLRVLRSEGGVKRLSGPEKGVVRANALKTLGASRFHQIRFCADTVVQTVGGYRLEGTLTIRRDARRHAVVVGTTERGDAWRISAESTVSQRSFGIRPYSILMGSVRVADEVTVSFTAVFAKNR